MDVRTRNRTLWVRLVALGLALAVGGCGSAAGSGASDADSNAATSEQSQATIMIIQNCSKRVCKWALGLPQKPGTGKTAAADLGDAFVIKMQTDQYPQCQKRYQNQPVFFLN